VAASEVATAQRLKELQERLTSIDTALAFRREAAARTRTAHAGDAMVSSADGLKVALVCQVACWWSPVPAFRPGLCCIQLAFLSSALSQAHLPPADVLALLVTQIERGAALAARRRDAEALVSDLQRALDERTEATAALETALRARDEQKRHRTEGAHMA